MKLLVVGAHLDKCEVNLLRGLAAEGVAITAILEPGQPMSDLLRASSVGLIFHSIRGRIDPASIGFLRPYFTGEKPDIVHCFSSNALGNVLIASARTGVKRVAYRGTSGHMSRLDPSSWLTYLNPRLHRIVCVSHAVERYFLERGVPAQRLVTIYKGHDPAWYGEPPIESLEPFGVPERSFVVSCVANMRPVKGVDILIEAVRRLPTPSPVHLLLVGEVRDARIDALRKDPELKEKVHFTGFRPDAPSIVARSDCFVMPSIKREGLPKALIEAMVKRIPPIVSDVGGMPEVVRHGIDGLVVPPSDPQALADAIIAMQADSAMRKRFSDSSYDRIVKNFNIAETIRRTLELYKSLSRSS